jgi:integrase
MSYVVQNKGRWYAVTYEGTDAVTGRDRRRWRLAEDEVSARAICDSQPEAAADTAAESSSSGITVGRFLVTRWLPAKEPTLRATTFFRYRRSIEVYVLPRIGRVPLRRLSTTHLERLYADLLGSGRVGGGGLAPKTVLNVHQVLRKALTDAMRKGLVARNVAFAVDPPRPETGTAQRAWTAAQLKAFLDVAAGHRHFAAIWLAANTGMRRGELVGLRWGDVDFEAATLSVHRSISCAGYRLCESDGKTRNSRRVIDLDAPTVAVLIAWHQQREREAAAAPAPDDPVFASPDGRRVHPHLLSQAFDRLVARARVPRIRLHDLRHTHATLMLKASVPIKVVSERLGHSTPAFTITTYQHVLPGMQRDAAALFGRLLDEATNPEETPVGRR